LFRPLFTILKKEVYDSGACTVYSSNAGTDRLHQKEKLSHTLIRGKTMRLEGLSLQKKKIKLLSKFKASTRAFQSFFFPYAALNQATVVRLFSI
jgi:hypothetical protein